MESKGTVHEMKHATDDMRFVAEELLTKQWGTDAPVGHLMVHDVKALTSVEHKKNPALFPRPPDEYLIRADVDGIECVVFMAVVNEKPCVLIHARRNLDCLKHFVVPVGVGGDNSAFMGSVLMGVFLTRPGPAKQCILYITDVVVSMGLRFVNNEKAPFHKRVLVCDTFVTLLARFLAEQNVSVELLPTTPCGPSAYEVIKSGTSSPMTGLVFVHKDSLLTTSTEVFVWQSLFTVVLVWREGKWWCVESGRAIDVKMAVSHSVFASIPTELEAHIYDGSRVTFKIKCTDAVKQEFLFTPIAAFSGQQEVSTASVLTAVLTACRNKLQWKGVMREVVSGGSHSIV